MPTETYFESKVQSSDKEFLRCFGSNMRAGLDLIAGALESDDVAHDSLLDKSAKAWFRLHLGDGSKHWVVNLMDAMDRPLLSVVAVDGPTGSLYTFLTPKSEIKRYEMLPSQMVAELPESERPYGFDPE